MVKTDCFAYACFGGSEEKRFETCRALNALYCKIEECKYYKPAAQACAECLYANCKGCAGVFNKPNP